MQEQNKTLGIIKPDAVKNNKIGAILAIVEAQGFVITELRKLQLSQARAEAFYEIHREKPFFNELISYMTSGSIVVFSARTQADVKAVEKYRDLIGNTDPSKAAEGSIRKLYGKSKAFNAVHGSDSAENASKEIEFFFSR